MKLKLKSSVSIIDLPGHVIEFFRSNTRQQKFIKTKSEEIKEFIGKLDGSFTLEEYIEEKSLDDISSKKIENFVEYLHSNSLLNHVNKERLVNYSKYRRVIHLLEDYSKSPHHLESMWNKLRNSEVIIIGLGAVGTWAAHNIVQSGVGSITLIDPDKVELSNLHRQVGFNDFSLGRYKVDVLEEALKRLNPNVKIKKFYDALDEDLLYRVIENPADIDLIINSADTPTVDQTSLWVGKYAMEYKIPHIVGGGYNLHLSLIGQTIIPYQSACVKCFELDLIERNTIDLNTVKKLIIKNRKIGSIGPMTSIIASFLGMEAIKVLSECTIPANLNRRGEFDVYTMKIQYQEFSRRTDCPWCGKEG